MNTLELIQKSRSLLQAGLLSELQANERQIMGALKSALRSKVARSHPAEVRYSIVVVTYWWEEKTVELLQALDSLATQSAVELVVVNNKHDAFATDALHVLKQATVITAPCNIGPSRARNLGANVSAGRYVVFVDDDGIPDDGSVEELVRVTASTGAVATRGRIVPFDEESHVPKHYDLGSNVFLAPPVTEGWTCWDRLAFLEFGGFNGALYGHEGIELCGRMLRFYGPHAFRYASQAILRHDFAPNDASRKNKDKRHLEVDEYLLKVGLNKDWIARLFQKYNRPGVPRLQVDWFNATMGRDPAGHSVFDAGPWLTVLTTVRDGEAFIEDYVRSLRLQTYKRFEVLVVDDGSSDGTVDRLRELNSGQLNMRIIASDRVGRAEALNIAVNNAASDICVIADVDDVSVSRRLEWTARFFMMYPAAACFSGYYFSDVLDKGPAAPHLISFASIRTRTLFGMPAPFPSFSFRRSKFSEAFDSSLTAGIDCEWIHRNVRSSGLDGALAGVPLVWYRLHDQQITASKYAEQIDVRKAETIRTHRAIMGGATDLDEYYVSVLQAVRPELPA